MKNMIVKEPKDVDNKGISKGKSSDKISRLKSSLEGPKGDSTYNSTYKISMEHCLEDIAEQPESHVNDGKMKISDRDKKVKLENKDCVLPFIERSRKSLKSFEAIDKHTPVELKAPLLQVLKEDSIYPASDNTQERTNDIHHKKQILDKNISVRSTDCKEPEHNKKGSAISDTVPNVDKTPCVELVPKDIFTSEAEPSEEKDKNVKAIRRQKYSQSFLNNPTVQEGIFQENLRAQFLLGKYFVMNEWDKHPQPLLNTEVEANALKLIRNVSALLQKYRKNSGSSEKLLKHKKEKIRKESNKTYGCPNHRKSPKNISRNVTEFDWDVRKAAPTSSSLHSSCESYKFLDTKVVHNGNQILYKNNSANLEKDVSAEEFCTLFQPERYVSIKNLYSYCTVENNMPQLESQHHVRSSVFNVGCSSQSEIQIEDSDYKKWLKHNNWVKYTNMTISDSVSFCTNDINRSISQCLRNQRDNVFSFKRQDICDNAISKTINNEQFYELILYEHIVVSNFVHFFSCYFCARRLKKFSITDRILQGLFLIMCYYVISFVDQSNVRNMFGSLAFPNKIK